MLKGLNMAEQINNSISLDQWEKLMTAVNSHVSVTNQPEDVLYTGKDLIDSNKVHKSRYFCYDNYDRFDVPGLDFIINSGDQKGSLTVYNGSEQARAPVTFEQGLQIAQNFFNEYGSQMAEEIVCDWVMDGNSSTL